MDANDVDFVRIYFVAHFKFTQVL
jgi:predicted TIM-barrel fold metal-dependent hydrolase